jgi:uncharacterized LabA/DUF88 family protein
MAFNKARQRPLSSPSLWRGCFLAKPVLSRYNIKMNNEAFIDGQNLRFSTAKSDNPWLIDIKRFRIYLDKKYDVKRAYYFIGYHIDKYEEMYQKLQEAGFILIFRKHIELMATLKKGNVDTDIVFHIMRKIADQENLDKIYLVSGDGDYFKMVQYLIEKGKFGQLLAPNERRMSSLYKLFSSQFYAFLNRPDVKKKIEYIEQK